jgi:hypothetical protein
LFRSIVHYPNAARPLLQHIPDFQQASLAILAPLMIPKPQRDNVLLFQKSFTQFIMLHSFRQTVLKAIQFDSQLCIGAIKIQNVAINDVLPAEFETGETSPAQRPPEFLFLVGLIATKLAGDWFEAHGERMRLSIKISSPLTPALSPFGRGEGEDSRNVKSTVTIRPQSFFSSEFAS